MKKIPFLLLAFFSLPLGATTGFSAESPAARTCRLAGGQHWDISIPGDEIQLCIFGRAMIGSQDFYAVTTLDQETLAVTAYFNQRSFKASQNASQACSLAGGHSIEGTDSNRVVFSLCEFPDSSWIESKTLARGPQAPENLTLTAKLKQRAH